MKGRFNLIMWGLFFLIGVWNVTGIITAHHDTVGYIVTVALTLWMFALAWRYFAAYRKANR